MVEVVVGSVEDGKKVHKYVRQLLPGVPLSGIHKMLRTGRIKRDGKRLKGEDTVRQGDHIQLLMAQADFDIVRKPTKKFAGVNADIDVVYENADMLVVNKPVGLLTHGAEGEFKDHLVNRVLAYLHSRGQLDDLAFTPAPVHRLDRNTSGLVIFAKTGSAARMLSNDLQSKSMKKWYIALVTGELQGDGQITAPLERDEDSNRTSATNQGKLATTRYRFVASSHATTLVQVELETGRTHQIRAHFSHIGHPLWGDVKYGARPSSAGQPLRHQWLHAACLEFSSGLVLKAPLPSDFVTTLRRLGYAPSHIEAAVQF